MEFTNLFNDEDAVSPVIGVILMVAITVILAAVIGTFVLGLGDQVSNTAPQASYTFDLQEGTVDESSVGTGSDVNDDGDTTDTLDTDTLDITHDGGDQISGSQLDVTASGAVGFDQNYGEAAGGEETMSVVADGSLSSDASFPTDVSAGTTVTYDYDDFEDQGSNAARTVDLGGATIRVTWQSSNGGDTATLGKWTGPDA